MEKRFNLNTDNTLGGENCSDYISPSQKAIKEYVDREIAEHAGAYRYTKTLVVTEEGSRTVRVSELYDGVEYTDSCIDVSSDGDTEIVVDELPLYKSVFVTVNSSEETIHFGFDLSDLEYGLLNCRSDCVSAFNRLSVPVLPLGARVVEFYLVGTVMSVRISDIHLDTYSYTPPEYLYFRAKSSGATVFMTSSMETAPDLEYSLDGDHFTQWDSTLSEGVHVFETITLANVDDTVWFRGSNPGGFAESPLSAAEPGFSNFVFSGTIEAGGNIQTIVDRLGSSTTAVMMWGMFADDGGDGSLVSAPTLPATTLSDYCYMSMFDSCTSLTAAPALPATTLAQYCYRGMFTGCTNLVTAPALAATTLATGCYEGMFDSCASLTTAPVLPATTLFEGCYNGMFYGCTFDMSDDGTTFNFRCGATLPQTVGDDTFSTPIELAEWMGNTNGFVEPSVDYLYFEAVEANSTVALMSMLATAPNLEYSTDGVTWQEWQHTTADGTHTFDTITLGAVGDRVYLRGVNPSGFLDIDNEKFSAFSMTGKIAAGGNAQSLVDGDTPTLVAKPMPMFSDLMVTQQPSDILTQAPALPATTLADDCYFEMFIGCTGLTQAPALPATTLADGCYFGMFGGCTGLTQAPALPATTLADACYSRMFYGCTGLTQAPALPATTLADGCYIGMFGGCTGLTQAPALPATTLADGCYFEMFNGCTGLTQAPALPATTLANNCYFEMFGGCTGLTQAPALPATTLADGCYVNMFYGCTSLQEVNTMMTDITASNCLDNWLSNVAAQGDFYCPAALDIPTGASGIPSGWTRHNYEDNLYLNFTEMPGFETENTEIDAK